MSVYVVRHGKAGSRRKWDGPDDLRPLTKAGRRQAAALADLLDGEGITRIISSASVRCRETVEPLAERRHLPVELSEVLVEGAPIEDALRLVEKVADEQAVLCTHGDVMAGLVWHAGRQGIAVDDDRLEKGSTWVFDLEAGVIAAARYVPPPNL